MWIQFNQVLYHLKVVVYNCDDDEESYSNMACAMQARAWHNWTEQKCRNRTLPKCLILWMQHVLVQIE